MLIKPESCKVVCRVLSALSTSGKEVLQLPKEDESGSRWPGLRVVFIEKLNGAMYIEPTTAWCASNLWETMLDLLKEYAVKPAITQDSGVERRVICLRNVCTLPLHVQHALRTRIEQSISTALFVLTCEQQGAVDKALKSRVVTMRPPQYYRALLGEDWVGANPPGNTRCAQAMQVIERKLADASMDDRCLALSRMASVDHQLSIMERRGAVVGAAAVAVVNRTWQKLLELGPR